MRRQALSCFFFSAYSVLCLLLSAPSVLAQDQAQAGQQAVSKTEGQSTALAPETGPETGLETGLERADAFFLDGVQLYRRGEYDSAVKRFEAALNAGADALQSTQRVRILRALGNCAYRRGKPLVAVGWYSAALVHEPRDADLLADVDLARSDAGLPVLGGGTVSADVHTFLFARRPGEARQMAMIGGLVLSLSLLLEIVLGGRALKGLVALSLVLALVMALPWIVSLPEGPSDPSLVLRSSAVAVRSEPRNDLPAVAHLEPGSIVSRLDTLDDWVQVAGPNDIRGWVPAGAIFSLTR